MVKARSLRHRASLRGGVNISYLCWAYKQLSEVTLDSLKGCAEAGGCPEANSEVVDDGLVCPPTAEEVAEAVRQLKHNKAPGWNEITAELLKLGGDIMVQWLTQLSQIIWLSEEVPADWRKQLTIPLHKKAAMRTVTTLGALLYLVFQERSFVGFFRTGWRRKSTKCWGKISVAFGGTRLCWSAVLSTHGDGVCSWVSPTTVLVFVDLKKAYDSVNHKAMWAALELKFGFSPKVLSISRALHK